MLKRTNIIEESKLSFTVDLPLNQGPPVEYIQIGCLQRIATSTEIIAKDLMRMQDQLMFYKNQCASKDVEIKRMSKQVTKYVGIIKTLKKSNETP